MVSTERTLALTLNDAVTLNDAAPAADYGETVAYSFRNETVDEARATRARFGAPEWLVRAQPFATASWPP